MNDARLQIVLVPIEVPEAGSPENGPRHEASRSIQTIDASIGSREQGLRAGRNDWDASSTA